MCLISSVYRHLKLATCYLCVGAAIGVPSVFCGSTLVAQKPQAPIQITADLSEAPRKLYHAEIDIPVRPGPVALITPQWIPGNHRPTGPVQDITGVVFTANGKAVPWRRDDVNLYEYHLIIPLGVTSIHAHLDCIVPARGTTTSTTSSSPSLTPPAAKASSMDNLPTTEFAKRRTPTPPTSLANRTSSLTSSRIPGTENTAGPRACISLTSRLRSRGICYGSTKG